MANSVDPDQMPCLSQYLGFKRIIGHKITSKTFWKEDYSHLGSEKGASTCSKVFEQFYKKLMDVIKHKSI